MSGLSKEKRFEKKYRGVIVELGERLSAKLRLTTVENGKMRFVDVWLPRNLSTLGIHLIDNRTTSDILVFDRDLAAILDKKLKHN